MKNANGMLRLAACVMAALVLSPGARAEEPLGSVALHQALLDVGTDLRLMCVAAHPDDEDSSTLAMYRKRYGYKTFAVLTTRGEGGQNEIGPELYEELGVIRTHEMLRASEYTGAEFHCLNLPEFGYSKSRDETYDLWGEEETLRRFVRIIRLCKPDVIITHHGPTGGHGHHEATGKTLIDAFEVAGDPSVFPEQITEEGLEPWQPARLFERSFSDPDLARIVDAGELDPARGVTYAQLAGMALREHESQGMGMFVDRFIGRRSVANYHPVREAEQKNPGEVPPPGGVLFDGLADRVSKEARAVSEAGITDELLSDALDLVNDADTADARGRAMNLARIAAGMDIATRTSDDEAVPGQAISVEARVRDFGDADTENVTFSIKPASWMGIEPPAPQTVAVSDDRDARTELSVTIPADAAPTIPHPEKLFDPHFLQPQFEVVATATIDGTAIEFSEPVLIDIAPATSLSFLEAPYLVRKGVDGEARFDLLVTNHTQGASNVTVSLTPPKGLSLETDSLNVSFESEGARKVIPVIATVDKGIASGDYALRAAVDGQSETAEGTARVVDVDVPENIKVGVVQSYDDTFMKTLERLKVPHDALEIRDFTPDRLDEFSTIILDIRTYLVRPDVVAANEALLEYVERGGTLIVMYHKTFEWKPEFAPYPIQLSRNRVTVEDAPIELLVPDHPLFTTPNTIVDSDWDGWIQERGLYFPARWDEEHYSALVDVADPGEDPPPGSVLVASYGDGTYMYTALGWYRQLRELHPGTLRVFANMLAL